MAVIRLLLTRHESPDELATDPVFRGLANLPVRRGYAIPTRQYFLEVKDGVSLDDLLRAMAPTSDHWHVSAEALPLLGGEQVVSELTACRERMMATAANPPNPDFD